MLGAPSTSAAFTAATDNRRTSFSMTPTWFLDTIDRDGPIAHWRLGEAAGGAPVTVLSDNFESFTGYNNYGLGSFVSSTAQARSGVRSGLKTGNNDPNGGWKLLPATVTGQLHPRHLGLPAEWLGRRVDRPRRAGGRRLQRVHASLPTTPATR